VSVLAEKTAVHRDPERSAGEAVQGRRHAPRVMSREGLDRVAPAALAMTAFRVRGAR
jgi:hypothetical protein